MGKNKGHGVEITISLFTSLDVCYVMLIDLKSRDTLGKRKLEAQANYDSHETITENLSINIFSNQPLYTL